jgi:hypothetical protein
MPPRCISLRALGITGGINSGVWNFGTYSGRVFHPVIVRAPRELRVYLKAYQVSAVAAVYF